MKPVSDHFSTLHYKLDIPQHGYVSQWIPLHRNEVRIFPRLNRSHSIRPGQKLRISCRGADRFDGRQAPLRHRNQFVGISPVQFGPGRVRAIRDLDAKLFRLAHS
jgi:hypothetical protein